MYLFMSHYNETSSLPLTEISAYLAISCFAIQIIIDALLSRKIIEDRNELSKEKLHYVYYIIYSILLISCLLTAILCEKTSLIFVFLILLTVTFSEYSIFCIITLLVSILFNIIFNKYSYSKDYDILKLIDFDDIASEVVPKLYIAAGIFLLVGIFIDNFMKNPLGIAIIKFIIFISTVICFVFMIETRRIQTIFPSYILPFTFAIIIIPYIYIEIRYGKKYEKNLNIADVNYVKYMSFCYRIHTKLSILSSNSFSTTQMIEILEFFQKQGIYVETQTKDDKIAFFPHITLNNIDKIIEDCKKSSTKYPHIIMDLKKLRKSYSKNWIKLIYDQLEEYSYKFYEIFMSIELDEAQSINTIIIILIVISLCITISLIDTITGIYIFLILVYIIYICHIRYEFFKDDMKKINTTKINEEFLKNI